MKDASFANARIVTTPSSVSVKPEKMGLRAVDSMRRRSRPHPAAEEGRRETVSEGRRSGRQRGSARTDVLEAEGVVGGGEEHGRHEEGGRDGGDDDERADERKEVVGYDPQAHGQARVDRLDVAREPVDDAAGLAGDDGARWDQ